MHSTAKENKLMPFSKMEREKERERERKKERKIPISFTLDSDRYSYLKGVNNDHLSRSTSNEEMIKKRRIRHSPYPHFLRGKKG